jgi:hypothetical protein
MVSSLKLRSLIPAAHSAILHVHPYSPIQLIPLREDENLIQQFPLFVLDEGNQFGDVKLINVFHPYSKS